MPQIDIIGFDEATAQRLKERIRQVVVQAIPGWNDAFYTIDTLGRTKPAVVGGHDFVRFTGHCRNFPALLRVLPKISVYRVHFEMIDCDINPQNARRRFSKRKSAVPA